VTMIGRVNPEASCGRAAIVDVRSPGQKGPSRTFFQVVLGLQPKQMESFDGGQPAGWRVNPDGSDSGTSGHWALGTPERSVAFEYTLQPGAAYSGSSAFVTGLSADELDNVDGKTTLESAPFGVRDLREPHLSYQVYFVATDFAQELLVPAASGFMRVDASLEGGNWVEVDRVSGMATGWQRRLARLSEKMAVGLAQAAQVRFRFVVEEATVSGAPVIEAVLDDVGIFAEATACDPGAAVPAEIPPPPPPAEGCSCDLGRGSTGATRVTLAPLLLLLALGLSSRRRRNPRR
jgi:hypothetical protein